MGSHLPVEVRDASSAMDRGHENRLPSRSVTLHLEFDSEDAREELQLSSAVDASLSVYLAERGSLVDTKELAESLIGQTLIALLGFKSRLQFFADCSCHASFVDYLTIFVKSQCRKVVKYASLHPIKWELD